MSPSFPRLDRYLARLPRGLGSYPECQAKAAAFRNIVESRSLAHFPFDAVPPELARLLRTPAPHTAWLSEVGVMAAILAMADSFGMSDRALQQWLHECNASLLANRMYRMLMALASPSMLMHGAATRWGSLHRGSTLEVTDQSFEETGLGQRGGVTITLRFPPHLYDEPLLRGVGDGFKTAASMSRARDTELELVSHTPRSGVFHISWY